MRGSNHLIGDFYCVHWRNSYYSTIIHSKQATGVRVGSLNIKKLNLHENKFIEHSHFKKNVQSSLRIHLEMCSWHYFGHLRSINTAFKPLPPHSTCIPLVLQGNKEACFPSCCGLTLAGHLVLPDLLYHSSSQQNKRRKITWKRPHGSR